MHIWKVLILNPFYFVMISFISKVYILRLFPPKMSSICFIFHLMNTQFFMSIARLLSVAHKIYIKNRIMLSKMLNFSCNSTLVILYSLC